jgi:hypothetical protein
VKSITEWFDEYSDSHQDQTNKKIGGVSKSMLKKAG